MNRLLTEPNSAPTPLFNPTLEDFIFEYDKTGTRTVYIIPAYDIATVPAFLADLFAGQMADQIIQKRGVKHNYEQDKREILSEILVKI